MYSNMYPISILLSNSEFIARQCTIEIVLLITKIALNIDCGH